MTSSSTPAPKASKSVFEELEDLSYDAGSALARLNLEEVERNPTLIMRELSARGRPTVALKSQLKWVESMLTLLETRTPAMTETEAYAKLKALHGRVKSYSVRVTADHLLLDQVIAVLLAPYVQSGFKAMELIEAAEQAIYGGEPLTQTVKRFDSFVEKVEAMLPFDDGSQAKVLLAELELRATLVE
jgi:DNA-binding NarL/FixJ family response regulator